MSSSKTLVTETSSGHAPISTRLLTSVYYQSVLSHFAKLEKYDQHTIHTMEIDKTYIRYLSVSHLVQALVW